MTIQQFDESIELRIPFRWPSLNRSTKLLVNIECVRYEKEQYWAFSVCCSLNEKKKWLDISWLKRMYYIFSLLICIERKEREREWTKNCERKSVSNRYQKIDDRSKWIIQMNCTKLLFQTMVYCLFASFFYLFLIELFHSFIQTFFDM